MGVSINLSMLYRPAFRDSCILLRNCMKVGMGDSVVLGDWRGHPSAGLTWGLVQPLTRVKILGLQVV